MAAWNFWNTLKTFKTTIEVPEPTADSVLTLPSGSQRLAGINDLQPNYRNRIINGAMNVNQINGTTAVTPTTGGYVADQWTTGMTQASKLTFQTVIDAPGGFKYSTKITVASQYNPLVADFFTLTQKIEGNNIVDFKFGTAGAVTINTSLWIKGSVAGTYSINLRNGDGTRSYVGTVTVGASWNKVSINLVGANDGTWNTDNTAGLQLLIDLGSGTNFNTTAGAWQNGNFTRTADSVTFVNQVAGSTLNITGVQLEKVPTGATQGTEYEWLPIEEEERRCARYLPVFIADNALGTVALGMANSTTTTPLVDFIFNVKPRISPTGVIVSSPTHFSVNDGSTNYPLTALAFSFSSIKSTTLVGTTTGLTAFRSYRLLSNSASGKILFTGAQL